MNGRDELNKNEITCIVLQVHLVHHNCIHTVSYSYHGFHSLMFLKTNELEWTKKKKTE